MELETVPSEAELLLHGKSKHTYKNPPHTKRISFSDDDAAAAEIKKGQSRKDSVAVTMAPDKRPEWYEDLGNGQINMFKEVFEMLDRDGGGSIDAEELYAVMKEMDIEITLEEIQAVLKDLDKDGNGEIDFDEFLFAMAETDRYLNMLGDPDADRDRNGTYSKRQTLFFTAITRFAIKNSLGEIERYYANKVRQAPHVISCYTAGARLIGLNDHQLEQEIRRMQKAAKNVKSPYAKPLPFFTPRKRKPKPKEKAKPRAKQTNKIEPEPSNAAISPKSRITVDIQPQEPLRQEPVRRLSISHGGKERHLEDMSNLEIVNLYSRACRTSTGVGGNRRAAITPEDFEILRVLAELAEKGNVVAKIPDIHLVPQIRNKLASGDVDPICSSVRKRRKVLQELPKQLERKRQEKPRDHLPSGWSTRRIERGQAPLPVVHITPADSKAFTIEDVPNIRNKVTERMDEYYSTLKMAHVKTAAEHWDQLHAEQIKSSQLREQFRRVYMAYSPSDEEEVFAISPWIPGRWKFCRYPRTKLAKSAWDHVTPSASKSPTPPPGSQLTKTKNGYYYKGSSKPCNNIKLFQSRTTSAKPATHNTNNCTFARAKSAR